jgi:DNA-binding CsgD family transcriptional regulator
MESIVLKINPKIVEQIYDVPLGLTSWNDVAISLQSDFKAVLGVFFLAPHNPQSALDSSISIMWDAFEQHFCKNDVEQTTLEIDDWVLSPSSDNEFFLSSRNFDKAGSFGACWNSDNLYHTMGTLVSTSNDVSMQIGFPRDKATGAYTKEEISRMKFYAKNIRRALELEGVLGSSLPPPIYEHALASSYGLTAAETRMVLELFKCGSLPDVAKALNRSYHTVRNQMKSVLVKTGASNQLTLITVLMNKKRVSQLH